MNQNDIVPNFNVRLVSGLEFELYNSLQKGPVILNFIMGTWCPFCDNHLKKIRTWQEKLGKNTTLLIISSQSLDVLRSYGEKYPTTFLIGSDPDLQVIKAYHTEKLLFPIAKPSTMLIDQDRILKMRFDGVRTDSSRAKMLKKITENGA